MTQEETLSILKTGANVFLTGEPGAGKTYVLNQYIDWLLTCKIPVAVTASTGIAATHIGGMTIHAWSGIGARNELSHYEFDQVVGREKTTKRIQKAKVLVIDEISMLDGRALDTIERVCRTIRGNGEAFGGLQVILVGDFFQLPPIAARGEQSHFAFESNAWERARFLTCYLSEQHRQEDELLLGLLTSIRRNDVSEEHYTLLSEQQDIGLENIEPTKLFTHNKDVDGENANRLTSLDTEGRTYTMEARGNKQLLEGLIRNCLSPQTLDLKLEAMVMCTKNNFEAGYVNGTLGRVVAFDREDGFPIIETGDGRQLKMVSSTWSIEEDGKVLAEVTQVPLRLAWAITIHKSQGMSLDAAEIDLRNAFTYGQGYVALSRVRSLLGMKVLGLNSSALIVDPKVVSRDSRFKDESMEAQKAFVEMDNEELLSMHKNFVTSTGGTWSEKTLKKGERKSVRMEREDTYEHTKKLLLSGLSAKQIAKERKMALSTIWSHLEKLSEKGELRYAELVPLIPKDLAWEEVFQMMSKAYDELGTEKLKPVYEALGEKYDYDLVRLGRILYSLT